MSKFLFIVESPNKCGKIRSFLGSDYNVLASVGHIREIPKKGLNIDIKNGFEPTYEITESKKDVVKSIKQAAESAEKIYLATDPDREGSAIAWSIYEVLNEKNKKKCVRVMFNEISKNAILKSLENPTKIEEHTNLINSAKARQILDRLIGYRVSPALWVAVGRSTSAGRVQSIALKLIVERQKEIEAFKTTDFWYIEALLQCEKGEFWSKVITKDKDNRYLDEKVAKDDLAKLKTASYTLDKIGRKTKNNNANPPFDTTSLQTSASSIFGWSATKTMQIAQDLYAAGKISYLRTDSYSISEDALKDVRKYIQGHYGKEYLPKDPNKYEKKSSAAAQEAHECIRPVHVEEDENSVDNNDERKLYKLIRDRFIACQMPPMVVDVVNYFIKTSSNHDLIAKGQTIKFEGWYKAYKYSTAKEDILPNAKEKEDLKLKEIKSTKHTTQPPARYNDGSIVKKMESEGVGRPSTRATIIKSIQDKGYVTKEKGKSGGFVATPLGVKISTFLEPRFKDFFMDIKYTSLVEEDLDEIAEGKKKYIDVLQKIYDTLIDHLKAMKDIPLEKIPAVSTGHKCTICKKGEIVERFGKYGKFFACNQYPACKTVYNKNEDGTFSVREKQTKAKSVHRECPECKKNGRKGDLVERLNRKSNNSFIGCSQWPSCKYVEKVIDDSKAALATNTQGDSKDDENDKGNKDDIDLDLT